MSNTMYRSYQLVGGEEVWKICRDDTNFDELKPTFITVLACDTLLAKDSPKLMVENCKYLGPMYFDLDSAEIKESIAGAQALWVKLKGYGVKSTDVEIYLSGKKGLHLLIPPTVFMEKVAAVNKLPAIYKEIAFSLAVDTLDFAVYSARKGRMFRTHYNVRDNLNYKVQITTQELEDLTPKSYAEICKVARPLTAIAPQFRPDLAILYEGLRQKISALKRIKSKPVDAATLRRHLPIIQQLMKGDSVREGVGFNKIAIQLGIYAHTAKLSEDELIVQCQGLIKNHTGDGYRYNSSSKREHELRRMYMYLDEGTGYDYALGPIQAMLETKDDFSEEEDDGSGEEFALEDPSGIFTKGNNYYVATEQGDRHVMDGRFKDVTTLLDPVTENIALLKATLMVGTKAFSVKMERDAFTNNSSLHKAICDKGASFTGSDIHSRYIYTNMLKETKSTGGIISYATTSEGLDVLCMPQSAIEEARKPFLVWADATEVRVPQHLKDKGLRIELAPDPGPKPTMGTDLIYAPSWPEYLAASEGNLLKMRETIEGLLTCQEPSSLAKMIGWTTATFFTQLFRRVYHQFPLMHIAGPAGTGKSRMMLAMVRMFYYREKPDVQPAASSAYALTSTIAGSASIPVLIDEYKPHTMSAQKVEELRSAFRSVYDGHSVTRGGGNRTTTSFRGLNVVTLIGPVCFIAEAMESESAILHRSVLISLKRQPGKMAGRTKPSWEKFESGNECLSVIGQHIAASIINKYTLDVFKEEFDVILKRVTKELSMQPEDNLETCDATLLMIKQNINERIIYNHAVAEFGLRQFQKVIELFLPEQKESLGSMIEAMVPAIYAELDKIVRNSVPEYAKVFQVLSDMSRFPQDHPCKLTNKLDFEVTEVGGLPAINVVGRLVYNKYRLYCRTINVLPLFMGDGSFVQAMKDSPLFLRMDTGTTQLRQESLVLDYEAMQRNGVSAFNIK